MDIEKTKKVRKGKNESSRKRETIFSYFRQGVPTLLCLPEASSKKKVCVWQA